MLIQEVKVTRIFSDESGHSHFQDIAGPLLYSVGNQQRITKIFGNSGIMLFEFESDFSCNWHLSSQRCYYIYIQGSQEVETSDGEKRVFNAGDILLAEDTFGHGHRSKSVSKIPGRAIIVPI